MPLSIARAKRSTSTDVLPVPAPAETKTSPSASIAACCSGVGGRSVVAAISASAPPYPAHRTELAPRRTRALPRVVPHVAVADARDRAAGNVPRPLAPRRDLVPVDVVTGRLAGHAVVARGRPQQPASLPIARERPVQA